MRYFVEPQGNYFLCGFCYLICFKNYVKISRFYKILGGIYSSQNRNYLFTIYQQFSFF